VLLQSFETIGWILGRLGRLASTVLLQRCPEVSPKICYLQVMKMFLALLGMIIEWYGLPMWAPEVRNRLTSFPGWISHWDPYTVLSLEAFAYSSYCNTMEWFWWD